MKLNILRHESVFCAESFGNKRIDVIGVGATGSYVTMQLAKLGISNIHVWDYDKVEDYNLPNQLFGMDHIDKLKVEALKDIIKATTGTEITVHNEKVDGTQELGEVVFLLTDTMDSRKQIFDKGLQYKLRTKLVIETRMDADNGRVYVINPCSRTHVEEWKKTLYTDQEATVSLCGTTVTVGPTAEYLAGLAVWQLIRWFNIESEPESKDELENEIIFSIRPTIVMSRKF